MPEEKPTQAVGVTGLSVWKGALGEEYLTALKGIKKKKVFREMQDDAVIGTLLDSIRMPLLAAEFQVQPASENTADQKAADFLNENMQDMTQYSWRQHVLDMLEMLPWGWSVSEVIFKKRSGANGDPASKYDDGRLGLHLLDPRGQETLERWQFDDEQSRNVEAMIQKDPNTNKEYVIPAWKMIHVTFRSRKRSPEGRSPLRSLYRPWYTRRNLEIIEAIGAERDLAGLPVMHLPQNATPEDKTAAETIVRNIRNDEEAGVVIPAVPVGAEHGWKLELMSGGSKMYNTRDIIRDLNKIIMMRFFAQFLLIGMEKVGTQALVKGSQDFFSLALESVQQELLEAWNDQLVPMVFKFNPMSGLSGLPTLDWMSPGKEDVDSVAKMLEQMIKVNVVTPSEELEDYIRGMAGLPERPQGVGEGPRQIAPKIGEMAYEWYQLPNGDVLLKHKDTSVFSSPRTAVQKEEELSTGIPKYKALSPEDWEEAYENGLPHWALDLNPSLFAQEFVEEMNVAGARNVLEIGCGNGRDSILFSRAGYTVTAVDVAPAAIELAKQNAADAGMTIDFRVANAEQLPFANGAFDAVYTLSVLHSTNLERSIAEAARVLKPGGIMFVYIYSETAYISGQVDTVVSMDEFLKLLQRNQFVTMDVYSDKEDVFDEFGEKQKIIVALLRYRGT